MPLRLQWRKKLQTSSERVKCIDIHPTESWVCAALYNGQLTITDFQTQANIKTIQASQTLALRCARFIPRQHWVICAGDDLHIRVFDYLSSEKVAAFEAHADYIRHLAVHDTFPLILSSSDDLTVKTWNWELGWQCVQTFEAHAHYVMMATWSPKDPQMFASASLDRTIKVWSIPPPGQTAGVKALVQTPHFSLSGHERGVNSVEYAGPDKPFLISGSDDYTVRVWDYQTRQCLQVLEGHQKNVCHAVLHPTLPLIFSASEDGTVMVWNAFTFRHEAVLDYKMGRVWYVSTLAKCNDVALATDAGTLVLSIGSDKPVVTMQDGKILFAGESEIFQANVRTLDDVALVDGERIPLSFKEVGSNHLFPQSISFHPNGRLVAVCGDGEYSVLTSQALRCKAYGQAADLVWSPEGAFAVLEQTGRVRVFVDFEEVQSFQPAFDVSEIFGGPLIGVRGDDFLCFYDWTTARFIRRVDVPAAGVYWTESGALVAVATEEELFILSYDAAAVSAVIATNQPEMDEGVEASIACVNELSESVDSGCWVGDCFVFLNAQLRLQILVGTHIDTLAFLPKRSFVLGYVPQTSRLYLCDRDQAVTSYALSLPFVQFQSAIAVGDIATAEEKLALVPEELHEKVARFLATNNMKKKALKYAKDPELRLDLALALSELDTAKAIVQEMGKDRDITGCWRRIGDCALDIGEFDVAVDAYRKGRDSRSIFLLALTLGDEALLREVTESSEKKGSENELDSSLLKNIPFLGNFLLHNVDKCIDMALQGGRHSEAAYLARTYAPSKVSTERIGKPWRENVSTINALHASRLAMPDENKEAFVDWDVKLEIEKLLLEKDKESPVAASQAKSWHEYLQYDLVVEYKDLGAAELKEALFNPGDDE